MADVYIPKGSDPRRPNVPPAQPRSNDQGTYMTITRNPIENAQGAVIMRGEQLPNPESVPVHGTETTTALVGEPVIADGRAIIAGSAIPISPADPIAIAIPAEKKETQAPAMPSSDVQVIHTNGAPISNDRPAIVHHIPQYKSQEPIPQRTIPLPTLPPGTPVSNESNVSFSSTIPRFYNPTLNQEPQAPPTHKRAIETGDTYIAHRPPDAKDAPTPYQSTSDAQILPPGGVMNVDSDVSMGGGGDTTKMAGSEDVKFTGSGVINVGTSDVVTAHVGNMTKESGTDDKTMAPNAGSLGNNEVQRGSEGGQEPVHNADFNELALGAVGKPLKKNVS